MIHHTVKTNEDGLKRDPQYNHYGKGFTKACGQVIINP